jgi:hypothetical protein
VLRLDESLKDLTIFTDVSGRVNRYKSSGLSRLMLDLIDIHVIFMIPPLPYSSFPPFSSLSTFRRRGLNRMSS